MLAQNFKLAEQLELTEAECAALIKVLGVLERGEVPHYAYNIVDDYELFEASVPVGFNMYSVFSRTLCGTAGCICGWAEYLGQLEHGVLFVKSRRSGMKNLQELFDPSAFLGAGEWGYLPIGGMEWITPTQAAAALRNYLTTGHPCWSDVLSECARRVSRGIMGEKK